MKPSHVTAAGIATVLVLWMASGMLRSEDAETAGENTADDGVRALMNVQVKPAVTRPMTREIVLQGELEAARLLELRAETSGTLETLPVERGQRVPAGAILATLSMDGREAELADAQAAVRSAGAEQQAARKLTQQGLQSQVAYEQTRAALAAARARLDAIERDIRNTQVLAPFTGLVNRLPLDIGEYVDRGALVAEVVDDSNFKVRAWAPQQVVHQLKPGQPVEARLITGKTLQGTIQFISAVADQQSHSFELEAEVDNPGEALAAGVSASLAIPVETVDAVFISSSTLSLGSDGELGVMTVNTEDQVEFVPIELISTSLDGAWVSGIVPGSRVITLGQGFVGEGEQVRTTLAEDDSSTVAN